MKRQALQRLVSKRSLGVGLQATNTSKVSAEDRMVDPRKAKAIRNIKGDLTKLSCRGGMELPAKAYQATRTTDHRPTGSR
jgi:hypothetical protein